MCPRFEAPAHKLSDAIAPTIMDFGLLAIYTLTAFAGAFVVFFPRRFPTIKSEYLTI